MISGLVSPCSSGVQTLLNSIKSRDLACSIEALLLKKCNDLTMKLEVKFLFKFLYLSVGLGMGNILAHAKESTNQDKNVLDFHRFLWSYAGPVQSTTCTPARKSHECCG